MTKTFGTYIRNNWWAGVQHGMALIGFCAPTSFSLGFDEIYIPGTYTHSYKSPLGSCPEIDNNVKWSETRTTHDAYELGRQDKIKLIIEYIRTNNNNLSVRPCWESSEGGNCGICEKCCRTATGFIIEGIEPKDVGFPEIDTKYIRRNFTSGRWRVDNCMLYMWEDIKKRLKSQGIPADSPYKDYLQWIINSDFSRYQRKSFIYSDLRAIKHRIFSVFKR